MHGLDTAEIFGVHDMLAARHGMYFCVQVGTQFGNDRIENGNTGNLKFPAALFKQVADVLVDNGVKNEAGIFADSFKCLLDLILGSDHRPKTFMGFDGVELR